MLRAFVDWLWRLELREATLWSLAVNVVVFILALLLGDALVRLWRHRPIALAPPPLSRSEVGLAAACVVLNSGVMLAGWGLFRTSVIRVFVEASIVRVVADGLVLLLVMDLAMYVTHRIAHHPLAFRLVHAIHHRYDAPRPLTLFVLHPLEVLGFGGLWLAVLCTHRFSLGGILLYLAFNTAFGTLGHVGVEPLPTAFVRVPFVSSLGTSTFHARHHQAPGTNFGFYTTVWDRLFGSLEATYSTRFGEPVSSTTHRWGREDPGGTSDERPEAKRG